MAQTEAYREKAAGERESRIRGGMALCRDRACGCRVIEERHGHTSVDRRCGAADGLWAELRRARDAVSGVRPARSDLAGFDRARAEYRLHLGLSAW